MDKFAGRPAFPGRSVRQETAQYAHDVHTPTASDLSFGSLVRRFASSAKPEQQAQGHLLPASILEEASEYFSVPMDKIGAIAGLRATTTGSALPPAELDACASRLIWELAEVAGLALQVFEDEAAAKSWLTKPNRTFLHSMPIEYLARDQGAVSVRQVLTAIATGSAA